MENVEDIINELNKLNNMEISNLDKIIEKSNIEILDIERKVFNLKTRLEEIKNQYDTTIKRKDNMDGMRKKITNIKEYMISFKYLKIKMNNKLYDQVIIHLESMNQLAMNNLDEFQKVNIITNIIKNVNDYKRQILINLAKEQSDILGVPFSASNKHNIQENTKNILHIVGIIENDIPDSKFNFMREIIKYRLEPYDQILDSITHMNIKKCFEWIMNDLIINFKMYSNLFPNCEYINAFYGNFSCKTKTKIINILDSMKFKNLENFVITVRNMKDIVMKCEKEIFDKFNVNDQMVNVFDPYFEHYYVKCESNKFSGEMNNYKKNEIIDDKKNIYSEADSIFMHIKSSIDTCVTLSINKTLYNMYLLYSKFVEEYFESLKQKCNKINIKNSNADKELMIMINTLHYCNGLINDLSEHIKKLINVVWLQKIDFSSVENKFIILMTNTKDILCNIYLVEIDVVLRNINYVKLNVSFDNSLYVDKFKSMIRLQFEKMKNFMLHTFKITYDSFILKLMSKIKERIFECKKIDIDCAKQLIIDITAIGEILNDIRKENVNSISKISLTQISTTVKYIVNILKVVGCS